MLGVDNNDSVRGQSMTSSQDDRFDYDQIIIGTGFGGSVSALRLSEKGHRVLMLEKGRRWKDEEFSDNS